MRSPGVSSWLHIGGRIALAVALAASAERASGTEDTTPRTDGSGRDTPSRESSPAEPEPRDAKHPGKPESRVVKAGPEVVDWSWIRMHQPRALVALIEDVQQKKLNVSTLAGLADTKTLGAILATHWSADTLDFETRQTSREDAPARSAAGETREAGGSPAIGAVTRGGASRAPITDPAGKGLWNSVELSSRLKLEGIAVGVTLEPNFRAPRCQPAEIHFPSLYDKQTAVARLRCTARTDGTAEATLEQQTFPSVGPLFRVLAIRSFTGRYQTVSVPSGGGAAAHLGVRIVHVPIVADEVSTAPFKLTKLLPGQDFEVDVQFQPTWNLVEVGAGRKEAKLLFDGRPKPIGPYFPDGTGGSHPAHTLPPWHAETDVSGMFNGLYLGSALVVPDDSSPSLLKQDWVYDPTQPQVFDVGVSMIPLQANARVEIVPNDLPAGVTMTPPLVAIQATGTGLAKGTLHFAIERNSTASIWHQPDQVAHSMVFDVKDSAGRSSTFEVALTLIRGHHKWSWEGDVGCIDKYYVDLTLLPEKELIAAFYLASRDHVFRCLARMSAAFDPGVTAWKFSYFIPRNDTVDTHQKTQMKLPPGGYRTAITRQLWLRMTAVRRAD